MYISNKNGDLAAFHALKNAISLKALGCCFALGVTGTVCVRCGQRTIGAWSYEKEAFHFAKMARAKPLVSVNSIEDLVTATNALAVRDVLPGLKSNS